MNNLQNLIVITGGARSGKSSYAEELARSLGDKVLYAATMPRLNDDLELERRISKHKSRRPASWQTIEAPYGLEDILETACQGMDVCIIDCLSLYVSNLLYQQFPSPDNSETVDFDELEANIQKTLERLLNAIERIDYTSFIAVTNEVGSSVVPENQAARVYRDMLGLANQTFARAAARAYLTCAGIPITLKECQTDSDSRIST